jgi:guanine deaminase
MHRIFRKQFVTNAMFQAIWVLTLSLIAAPTHAAETRAVRSAFLDFIGDPFYLEEKQSVRFVPDGLLIIEDGKIKDFGHFEELKKKYRDVETITYKNRLIMPGFIDCHVHYPQTRVVAAYGNQLLEWLTTSIFPEELKFSDSKYARKVASIFLEEMLSSGTTTVQSFATTSPVSVEVFFEEAEKRNMRVITGLTGIDRKGFAPDEYLDTAESFYQNSKKLCKKWHGRGRNLYAITPRFAFGSTDKQLELAGQLRKEIKGVYMNTHLSEQ